MAESGVDSSIHVSVNTATSGVRLPIRSSISSNLLVMERTLLSSTDGEIKRDVVGRRTKSSRLMVRRNLSRGWRDGNSFLVLSLEDVTTGM